MTHTLIYTLLLGLIHFSKKYLDSHKESFTGKKENQENHDFTEN